MNRVSIGSDYIVAYSAPSGYLNQCRVIVDWTVRNKLHWNLNLNSIIFIQVSLHLKMLSSRMASILSRGRWVDKCQPSTSHIPGTFNTLRLRQNGCHFTDVIFKFIFLNEYCCILIELSIKSVPEGLVNKTSALVQIMAWRQTGNKPLSEPMMG